MGDILLVNELASNIIWETIDEHSAIATMECHETKSSGVFHFDENGNFKKFAAISYKDSNDAEPTQWTITSTKIEERNGIKIP